MLYLNRKTLLLKRSPFGVQKDYIWKAKGLLLHGKRGTFEVQKGSFWKMSSVK